MRRPQSTRSAVTWSFRNEPTLGALSPATPRALLSHGSWLPRARSPSLPIAALRFCARRQHALLWIRLPPTDFCNDHRSGTHPRAPDSRAYRKPRVTAVAQDSPSFSPRFFWNQGNLPLSRKDHEAPRAATALFEAAFRRCKHAESWRPQKPSPNHDIACGRCPDPITACGDERWTKMLDCTGRATRSEGPSQCCLLPQNNVGGGSPPHWAARASFEFVVDPSSEGLDAPLVLVGRPRPSFHRHPAKGQRLVGRSGCLSPSGIFAAGRSLLVPKTGPSMTPLATLSCEPTLQAEMPTPLCPSSLAWTLTG